MKKIIEIAIGLAWLANGTWGDVRIRQLTFDDRTHALGVYNPWSPNDQWIVFVRGPNHLNDVVEKVNVRTGEIKTCYRIAHPTPFGPGCGTASYCETSNRIVFIHGPQNPAPERKYEFWRRGAAMVDGSGTDRPVFLDARDTTAPFTEGALRGGTHCHQFSRDGNVITFTYNDMLVSPELRTIGVSKSWKKVTVDKQIENHDGAWFSALLVPVVETPKPGSGELSRAYENCWVEFPDGRRAVAFKGNHLSASGEALSDLFLVNVPETLEAADPTHPLAGTKSQMPSPPKGAAIRQLTHFQPPGSPTLSRTPRFWLSATPDGSLLFFLARDAHGINQVYSIPTHRGALRQMTSGDSDVESTVEIDASGKRIAYLRDGSIFVTRLDNLATTRLTRRKEYHPVNVKWSHGNQLVFENRPPHGQPHQLFVIDLEDAHLDGDAP